MFGGLAKDRPYPGSTTVSTVNGGVTGWSTLATELAPVRVNAIHPGIVGDSPYWSGKPAAVLEGVRSRTPTGRLVTMADIVDAVVFLLENPSVNAANLPVDGGLLLTMTAIRAWWVPAGWAPRWPTRLRRAGRAVVAYNRTRSRAECRWPTRRRRQSPGGGGERGRRARLARRRRGAFGRVPGPDGLVAGFARGAVVVETSTVDPDTVRALAPRSSSGRRDAARRAGVGQRAGRRARRADRSWSVATPVRWTGHARCSTSCAARVFHLGGRGSGATMKLVVNSVVHALNQALSEALVLAERAGLARETAYDVFATSAVAAPFVQYKRSAFEHPEDTPVAFRLDLRRQGLRADRRTSPTGPAPAWTS